MPPSDYVVRVGEVLGYRLEWLLHGTGDPKGERDGTEDRLFESQLYEELLPWLKQVEWAETLDLRLPVLRLLGEVGRAVSPGKHHKTGRQAALRSVVRFLNTAVPSTRDPEHFVPLPDIPKRRATQVWMHIRGIVYLLLRPFIEEEESYLWARAVSRPSESHENSEDPHA